MSDLDGIVRQAEVDIHELEGLLASAEARVAVAEADAAAVRARLDRARIALEWLREHSHAKLDAPEEKSAEQPKSHPATRFGKPVPEGPSKLQQVIDALNELGGAATNKQIGIHMNIPPDHVRGLLKYESSKQHPLVVTEAGSGVWRLTRSLNGAGGAR